jgi:protein ImuA
MPCTSVFERLKREMLQVQGFRPLAGNALVDASLGPIREAFPDARFPLGAVHEWISDNAWVDAANCGFISHILSGLMQQGGTCIWISKERKIFPPALLGFGIQPQQIIFVDLLRERDICWAMEESLHCEGLSAVVGELRDIDFTGSRRLQLAVEQSRVTGFLLRKRSGTSTAVSRWRISPVPSQLQDDLPGVGFPRWKVELLKARNGLPGTWIVEYKNQMLQPLSHAGTLSVPIRKTG